MKKEIHRSPLIFFVLLVASALGLGAQGLLIGHIDFTTYYSGATGEWISEYRYGEWDNPNAQASLEAVSLPARDIPFNYEASIPEEIGGERLVKPTGFLDFIGVANGDPFWVLSQSDNGHSWPGFRSDQSPGTFRPYNPVDSRVTSVPQPWMTLQLVDVTYAGMSNNPQFSLWQIQNGNLVQWMATSDGIDSDDIFYIKEGAHSHASTGFSNLGLYRIGYKPSAILEATGETVEGTRKSVTYAIGTKAAWTALYYAGDDLFAEAISGDDSDSDMDGVQLLLEYAFNLDPVTADAKILEQDIGISGLPLVTLVPSNGSSALQIEYVRRKAETNPQISYFPEFKSSLAVVEWEIQTAEIVTPIDEVWERVIVTDSTDTSSANQRFGRIRVEVQEIISY